MGWFRPGQTEATLYRSGLRTLILRNDILFLLHEPFRTFFFADVFDLP